jgi:hypothetical protein
MCHICRKAEEIKAVDCTLARCIPRPELILLGKAAKSIEPGGKLVLSDRQAMAVSLAILSLVLRQELDHMASHGQPGHHSDEPQQPEGEAP